MFFQAVMKFLSRSKFLSRYLVYNANGPLIASHLDEKSRDCEQKNSIIGKGAQIDDNCHLSRENSNLNPNLSLNPNLILI